VGLAQAIVHKPRLLILDEPTIGLDPTQVVEVRRLIRRLSERSTVLLSTHILSEVEALCDRVIILINGRIRADAKLSELASTSDAILVLNGETPGVDSALLALGNVKGVEALREMDGAAGGSGFPTYRVLGKDSEADLCPAIYDLARNHDWPVRELRQDVRTLESVFNELATTS
jgi:ABC-2 type transport system ATP-binding protein